MVEIRPLTDLDALRRLGVEAGLDAGDERDEHILAAWGAFLADDLVGGVALECFCDLDLVTWLSVRDGDRGKGIGRRLLKAAETEASSRGVSELWATARSPGFFMRAGYSVAGGGGERELLLPGCNACEQYQETCHPKVVMKRLSVEGGLSEPVNSGKWGDRG